DGANRNSRVKTARRSPRPRQIDNELLRVLRIVPMAAWRWRKLRYNPTPASTRRRIAGGGGSQGMGGIKSKYFSLPPNLRFGRLPVSPDRRRRALELSPMIGSLIVSLALLMQAGEAAPAADELATQVQRLVRQLDDEQLARREAAEKGLVELGPKALSLLPPNSPRLTAETRERLGRARRQLEIALAESAAEPTRVTLSGSMKLSE